MIPFKTTSLNKVTPAEMAEIYEQIKTPYKYGAVLKLDNDFTDSPSVFRYNGRWYMYYISISKDCSVSGYETHLAVSDDLVNWEKVNTIFRRDGKNRWDSKQCAGYAALFDINFGGSNELGKLGDKYYISYLAGNSDGYEPDPLFMGLAFGNSPVTEFTRMQNPILRPDDSDSREHETKTLYKSYIFYDDAMVTGYPYVNVYNGKAQNNKERIYLAVSNDGEHFERYGDKPIIDDIINEPDLMISGDAQIVKIGDIYVMFYFKYDGKHAYETFAASRDLVEWTRWQGEPLVKPLDEIDNLHAHKPWVIKTDGVVYHYYCACNDKNERFIALATSEKID